MTFLEVDRGLRDWRKATVLLSRMVGTWEYVLMYIDEVLHYLHSGGSWDGYIGPERQLKGLWSPIDEYNRLMASVDMDAILARLNG